MRRAASEEVILRDGPLSVDMYDAERRLTKAERHAVSRPLQAHYLPLIMRQEPVRHCLRDVAKEVQADARPQATRNRRRIHWNTLRIYRGREQSRCLCIVRCSRTVNVGQAPNAVQSIL